MIVVMLLVLVGGVMAAPLVRRSASMINSSNKSVEVVDSPVVVKDEGKGVVVLVMSALVLLTAGIGIIVLKMRKGMVQNS